nr:uncharacterized protein LOC121503256 [Drosophila kikkawai]
MGHQCKMCRQKHPLRFCEKFLKLDFIAKRRAVRRLHYCVNCLASSHTLQQCRSKDICHVCGELHHTILHGPAEETKGKESAKRTRPDQQHTKERESRNRQQSSGKRSYHRSPSNKPSPLGQLKEAIRCLTKLQSIIAN